MLARGVAALALALSGGSAACASPATDGPTAPTAESAVPLHELVARKVGPERASLTASSLDYGVIPLLGPSSTCVWDASPETPDPCAPFFITKKMSEPKCDPPHVPHPRPEWTLGNTTSQTATLRTFTERKEVEWTAIKRPSGTDALFVSIYTGDLRGEEGGLARSRRKVAALAVVPHQVYVFRTCEEGCDAAAFDAKRVERLTLVGPPSVWVGSSGDPVDAPLSGDDAFTMISALVQPGGAASLTIAYTSVAGSRFQGGEAVDSVAANVQTVTVEAVWDGPGAPSPTVYRGTIPAGAASDVSESRALLPECE